MGSRSWWPVALEGGWMDIPERVRERFLDSLYAAPGGCIFSTLSCGSHGYTQVGWKENGKRYGTTGNRVAWVIANGPIPEGYDVHHKCFVRRCNNPMHLEAIPAFENRRRHSGQDWSLGVCKNGHPNSEMIQLATKRRCGVCHADDQRRGWRKHAAKRRRERFPHLADRKCVGCGVPISEAEDARRRWCSTECWRKTRKDVTTSAHSG